jgi:hypothetical protein
MIAVYTIPGGSSLTPPTVYSVTRDPASPNPTHAASVNFIVTFSEPVTGVDTSDFSITRTGSVSSGAVVSGVSGSGNTYTVAVNTGLGDGTIRLDVIDNNTIVEVESNHMPLNGGFMAGEAYTIDKTAPFVTIARASSSPTNAANINFTVTFTEIVLGVDTTAPFGDFSLVPNGITGASITSVTSVSGKTYTISVNTGSGTGTLGLRVVTNAAIMDLASNPLAPGMFTDGGFTIDRTMPTVQSITRVSANPTNTSTVNFTITFPESVTGVDVSDFSLTTSRISNATVSSVSGSGSSRTVTVNTGSGNGSIRLNLVDNNSIVDASNNPLGGPAVGDGNFTAGQAYTIIKSATFADVPMTYWANTDIERAYNAGITGGCTASPLNYCPENMVTRAQMAVFLLKGVHGSGYTPPAVGSSTGFADVPVTYWAAAWIKQLAVEGITGGCGGGNYCPEGNVTRAQMAVFLLKAKHGSAYVPPAATGLFADVPIGYWARNWIEQLAVEGITAGCGGGNYCPESNVTRAQMAVFLVKTFNLP